MFWASIMGTNELDRPQPNVGRLASAGACALERHAGLGFGDDAVAARCALRMAQSALNITHIDANA